MTAPERAGHPESERRAFPRAIRNELAAVIVQTRPDTVHLLKTVDMSKGGARLASRQAMPKGERGVLQVVRNDGNAALLGFVVMHSRYTGEHRHECGVQFGDPSPEIPLHAYLDTSGRVRLLHPLLAPAD